MSELPIKPHSDSENKNNEDLETELLNSFGENLLDDLHWRNLYAKTPAISPSLLALTTLGVAT
jgi:hypothetical protein